MVKQEVSLVTLDLCHNYFNSPQFIMMDILTLADNIALPAHMNQPNAKFSMEVGLMRVKLECLDRSEVRMSFPIMF